ncbi:MAG: hypothetical protein ABIY47_01440, partial [Opitutaceae bacterium]
AAIWHRASLQSLLRRGESIWEFEQNGNARADHHATGFYATWKAVVPYQGILSHHVVEKGLWLPHEKWIFQHQNIGCDFSRRQTLRFPQVLFYHCAQFTDKSLNLFPWRLKTRIKRAMKRLLRPLFENQFSRMNGNTLSEHQRSSK